MVGLVVLFRPFAIAELPNIESNMSVCLVTLGVWLIVGLFLNRRVDRNYQTEYHKC
jgi:hypothetical protein